MNLEFIPDENPRDRVVRLLRKMADDLDSKSTLEFIRYKESHSDTHVCSGFEGESFILHTDIEFTICLREWK